MSEVCPSCEKCPIFCGILKDKSFTTSAYQDQFCKAGEEGRNKCRRWQCKQKYGKVPDNLLPNSNQTIEEIGQKNNWV